MVSETFSDVYPEPGRRPAARFRHLCSARQIIKSHRHVFGVGPEAEFDEDGFVIRNAYTGGSDNLKKTFDEAPRSTASRCYNEFCGSELDYDRGDDVIQIGRLDLAAARRYLVDMVPRGRLAALVARWRRSCAGPAAHPAARSTGSTAAANAAASAPRSSS